MLGLASFLFVHKVTSCLKQDPVTGSAHCTLGPYWADKLQKDTLEAYQVSGKFTILFTLFVWHFY